MKTIEELELENNELKARLAQVDMNRPFIAVDIICLLKDVYFENDCYTHGLVLIERKWPPYGWALPGGHIEYGESAENAAIREMKEETGLDIKIKKLVSVNSEPNRDPRKHTISISYLATANGTPKAADDAKNVKVFPMGLLPDNLCFDHKNIISLAHKYVISQNVLF